MSQNETSSFLVDAYSDPVIVKITGRVSFMNSGPLRDFFSQTMGGGKRRFIVDFADCTSMDSTFLGIMAGAALDLRRFDPPGSIILCRLGARNLELVRNLGLHRIMTVDSGELAMDFGAPAGQLENKMGKAELENARLVLRAHENLIEADEKNRSKFQDVVGFLKNQVERM
jgi:anti-sigma B factor antagonist